MKKKIVLCFDTRAPLETRLATVDQNIWPNIWRIKNDCDFKKKSPIAPLPMECAPTRWPACSSFFSCIPPLWIKKRLNNDFCINAYCVAIRDFLFIQHEYGEYFYTNDCCCNPPVEFLAKNGWHSLGFDICDADLCTSLIHTTKEMQFSRKYEYMWNEHGLIKKLVYCRRLMRMKEYNPRDPTIFIPVEIYTNNFTAIKIFNK